MKNKNLEPIAVIGIGAIMPGALNKDEFWNNIQTGKYCITEVPASYWDWHLYYSPDHKAEDKLYSKIGGFIPQTFKFNPLKYRIPPQIAKQMDTIQHLAIETANMALADAGYDKKEFDRNRTAVIIGNSMGGMKNDRSNLRLNRPVYYEILKHTPTYQALPPETGKKLLDEMEDGVRANFMPVTEDSMPGELANVIAGRVANVFDLHGTNFTVDAACATSLAAIDQAVNGLRMGNFDMALVGGVDQMMAPASYIKFCKIGALSENGSCPFDAKADGFVMAEGAGTVILKRLSDAVKDGDRVYAVIRAIGASSDGKGKGITAPNPKGQKIAVEKTFEQLDYTPGDVGLIEAHGTSTRVGDAVELNALNEIFGPYAKPGTIGLGSVKSQIGHAKAAAGIASFIKTSLALYNRVLPPSVNFETPNPTVDWCTCPFRVITQVQPWPDGKIRRANVSAFGFGGTNFHVAMEEMNDHLLHKEPTAVSAAAATPQEEQPSMNHSYILHMPGEKIQSDVLTFSAPTKQELFSVLDKAMVAIQYDPTYLPKISYKNHMANPSKFAVTINAESAEKLKDKIEFFKKTASSQDVWEQESLYLRMKGIYPFTPTAIKPKVCFMFPGQGSQYVDMMKDLASKYKIVQDTFDEADRLLTDIIGQTLTETLWSQPGETKEQIAEREAAIKRTEMTQPAVLTADIAMMRLLSSFGIKPDVVMGHSLGEYAAAVAAGIFDFENGLKAVCTRGKVMSEIRVEDNGKMASIAAPVERVEPELARVAGYVAVANKNCPTQTVIAGASKSIDDAIKMFTDMGIQAVQIPVSHAFHSAIVQPAMPQYRAFLDTLTFHSPKMPITTNVTAEFYPSDPEKIKDLMVTQISHSVEWMKQLRTTYDSGVRLFVECGPKRVLSALASNTLTDKKDIKVLASNHPKKGGIVEFNDLFANLISSGIHIDWTGTDMSGDHSTYNPAFYGWVTGDTTPVAKTRSAMPACYEVTPAQPQNTQTPTPKAQPKADAEDRADIHKSVVISGIAAGGPGSWDRIFREGVLDEILSGRNMIEPVSSEVQQKQIDKHVEFVIKSKDGNHRFERLTSASQAIKLSAKGGAFDLEKEFGLPAKWVRCMDRSFQLAIAAGMLALKDAGIPLVLYYKPTSTGGYLPDRWGLPADMIDETGVIFTSAFPVANSMMGDLTKRVTGLLNNKTAKEVRAFCDKFITQIADPVLKAEIENWYQQNFKDKEIEPAAFTSEFILKTIIIAHAHFCQWIRARGPATAMSSACASTAQAVAIAQDWIKLGRCKRVIVIGADDITNDNVSEWILTAFLASGAATTEGDVTKAALPFDRRRNGMIVGMGAVSLVVEEESEVAKRGMKPLAKLLSTEIANSGFHVTRLDVGHIAQVMNRLVATAEREHGLNRADIAKQLVFISHETYTPARGGSASAEAYALKNTFGDNVSHIIVSNTKGFTGHSMGAGLEDVIAVRCLNTGIVPPIANFKEADPELNGITLSKGGHYDFKYALRLAAGFGSQIGMTLLEKSWQEGEPRIADVARHAAWLKEISGQASPVLEVVKNTLRIKDNYQHGVKPSLVMEGSQAFVDKVNTVHMSQEVHAAPQTTVSAPAPVTPAAAVTPAPAVAPAPAPKAVALDEASVTKEVVNMVSEKTGYPEDMLDLDLDMEADLGIDTVKQAELFAAMREHYGIVAQEGIQLKDYPTIRHCIKFVLSSANGTAATPAAASAPVAPAPVQTPVVPAPAPVAPAAVVTPAPAVAPAPAPKAVALDEASVTKEVVNMVAEKTGYPEDMLDLDLDMEADLGIDTVKQAELFAAMREHYGIVAQEGIQLKDYPTIRHCIKFVLSSAKGAVQAAPSAAVSAPVPAATPSVQAAAPTTPTLQAKVLDEAAVTKEVVGMVAEKTGYPEDMLDLDLDMEADLGIDTVKQAELFAAMREHYGIVAQEGIQLKDYPTIRHCIKFVLSHAMGAMQPTVKPTPAPAPQPSAPAPTSVTAQPAAVVTPAPAVAPAPAPKAVALDEASVTKEIVKMVAEKTGYPEDMLELDLDMEADLGIDTVKQAELFAAMREYYGIAVQEGIQLKDYPTIRHCINFALSHAGAPLPAVAISAPAPTQVPAPATPVVEEQTVTVQSPVSATDKVERPSADMLTTNPTEPVQARESLAERPERVGYAGEHCHEKKLRHVTMVAPAPLAERENRRLSKDRTVLIFADNAQLIKAYQEECKELGVKYHVFTTLKTRSKNTTIVNWESYEETEAALKEYAAEDPNVQGIVYLLGANVKKFDKKVSPHNELTKYVMPLFIALRVFEKGLSNRQDADSFFAVNTKIDGTFGYTTKDEFIPITGALCGGTTCFRKDTYERTGALGKLLDFEPTTTPDEMARTTIEEVLHGDMRLMIGTRGGERSTILSVPVRLDRSVKHTNLAGKTIIFTGSGRGIGAMLSQKIAAQYHSKIIVLDIIEIQEKTPLWATMNEAELAALKKQMWEELKADPTQKATPVLLERAFGRVKDSITLYNNLQKLRELGSEVEYHHCDVLNSSMVKEVCTKIKAKNGRVDGLIHFAGLERSKLIYDKDPAEYYRIFDVKAASFASFLANNIVREGGFFAFASSIAGKYGNLGQCDYASANDYLAKSAFTLTNQGYRAVAIAMSAYKNVGMGIRAGVETFLRSNGVDFVDPEDGMQIFLDEIVYGTVPEIVLTGALGRLDWDHQLRQEMDEIISSGADTPTPQDKGGSGSGPAVSSKPSAPAPAPAPAPASVPVQKAEHFLGKVASCIKGQEIHLEKEFNLESDPYLADHAIEGTPYVPGVMGIETFMETATELTDTVPQGLKDVHFYLPIKLLRNRPQAVRVIGKTDGAETSMEIESDFINSKGIKMGNTRRHFTAKVLGNFVSTWDTVKEAAMAAIHQPVTVTKEEIYQKYFHGPSFQVLGGILSVDKNTSVAIYNTTPRPQWPDGPKTLLANPMLIEAAFQCCGFQDMTVERKMTLPDGIAEIAVLNKQVPPAQLYLYGVNRGHTADGKTLHDAYVFDEAGNVWVEFHGYQAIGQ